MKKAFIFSCFTVWGFGASAQNCGNLDFETNNFSGWGNAYYSFFVCDSIHSPNPMTNAGFNYTSPNNTADQHNLNLGSWNDPGVTTFSLQVPCPYGGNVSARLGDEFDNCGAATMAYSLIPSATCSSVTLWYALVLFDNHSPVDSPKFIYKLRSQTGLLDSVCFDSNSIPNDTAFHPADLTLPGLYYKNWTPVCFDLSPYLGMNLSFEFLATDCDSGKHRCYAYIDFNITPCAGSTGSAVNSFAEYNLKVFPNPTSDKLNLTLKNLEEDEFQVTLCDVQSTIILKDNFAAAPGQITRAYNTEDLPPGVYFVTIKTKMRGTIQQKLIIN